MSELTERTDFGFIRYANCWEDADVLLHALQLKPGASVLSIGSAGDNSFSILASDPEIVVAVDLSNVQLHLIELKRAAIRDMECDEFLGFIGVRSSDKRIRNFELLKKQLPADTRKYWETNLAILENGLLFGGKFERYFRSFRCWLLPLIHSRKTRLELFRDKDKAEQEAFYDQNWNNYRWKFLFRIFFSKWVMGKYGRDPAFLNEVKVPVHEYIFRKAEKHLASVNSQENYFLRMILLGEFGETLPHYLRKENYAKIRANLDRLKTYQSYAEDAMKMMPRIDACNLSDIFEYMPAPLFQSTAETIALHTTPGCKLAYWNLMVPRRLSGVLPEKYSYDRYLSQDLTDTDNGFFYSAIHLDTRI